ncbi:hypothetical protein IE53DRAFT_359208 [Violaceomyces palustris]|uniref:Uncharacterized protein n=1 Tax=Violaceomyces palustris TaxID=1673888 RepID=A0ACD0P8D5_9BASI|nr:hypothetical protein IE53DRAFT_359208 [Violaceomyces palustris]
MSTRVNTINSIFPLVIHGYLRPAAAKHAQSIIILRSVTLGIFCFDTAMGAYKIAKGAYSVPGLFLRRQQAGSEVPKSLAKSVDWERVGLAVCWAMTRASALAWIWSSINFSLKEYPHGSCTSVVQAIMAAELLSVIMPTILALWSVGTSRVDLRCPLNWHLSLIASLLLSFGWLVARCVKVSGFDMVQGIGFCGWIDDSSTLHGSSISQILFWNILLAYLVILSRRQQNPWGTRSTVQGARGLVQFAGLFGPLPPFSVYIPVVVICSCHLAQHVLMTGPPESSAISHQAEARRSESTLNSRKEEGEVGQDRGKDTDFATIKPIEHDRMIESKHTFSSKAVSRRPGTAVSQAPTGSMKKTSFQKEQSKALDLADRLLIY